MTHSNTTDALGNNAAQWDENDSMEDFDALPPPLREKLRHLIMSWSARYVRTTILPYARTQAPAAPVEATLRYLDYDNAQVHDVAARAGIIPRQRALSVTRLPGHRPRRVR